MIIGLPSNGNDLNQSFAPNFGRCSYFIIYNSESKKVLTAFANAAQNAAGGAGIQAAQTLINNKVDTVIAPQMGPNAWNVLQGAGIKIFSGVGGSVQQNVDALLNGQLNEMTMAQGRGIGRGRGRGMGRGQGRGRGNF
jgi:predicted Fe-Mo cluster-binding NifX family protein